MEFTAEAPPELGKKAVLASGAAEMRQTVPDVPHIVPHSLWQRNQFALEMYDCV